MMQPEVFQPSWPFYRVISSNNLDQLGFYGTDMDAYVDACQFSSSFVNNEDIYDISSMFPAVFNGDQSVQSPPCVEDFLMEGFEPNLFKEMELIFCESEGNSSSSEASMDTTPIPQSTLELPGEELQLENQVSLFHLLKAYGEAMDGGQSELADVIMRCVSERVSPAGEALECLAFNLCHDLEKQGDDYIKRESCRNFELAFMAFYQLFPYGRFAHFAANSAILEALPADAETIHIVDFDLGGGIQWPPLIEDLAHLQKAVRLTAIKWKKDDCNWAPMVWSFDAAKRRLLDHARCCGLNLKVEEMGIEDLASEEKKANKRGGGKEWLVFNTMLRLPHMGRARSRQLVEQFLRVAGDLVANSAFCNSGSRGIITFGDGDSCENLKNSSDFGSFFEGNMAHYKALIDSIESKFPVHHTEARMTLECLFVAPYVSSQDWYQKWVEMKQGCNLELGNVFEGWRVSRVSLEEAREVVGDEQSSYGVRIGGDLGNEMILQWKSTPLVRVSTWRK
ncbi:hypothetical protein POTOM_051962 [Populus tomentosa]|uniref:Nodulation-signaling pathway 2 protein-like n=1 Tax=Populus tomentosa TaxID=118781 RepID=A0A8X8C8Q6_POPTO|nr:hypothetical protein POTOM_051962 [Populus tomentosa]